MMERFRTDLRSMAATYQLTLMAPPLFDDPPMRRRSRGLRRSHINGNRRREKWLLAQSVAMARHQPNHHGQGSQYRHEVGSGRIAVLRWRIAGKQAYSHAQSHQAKHPFAQSISQGSTYQQHHGTLKLAESIGSFAAVKDPERDQVQRIQPCAGSRQRGPESIAGLKPKQSADAGGKPPGQRSSQTDGGAGFQGNTERIPLHVRPKSGKKHGHVGGQAAALDVDEVSHFMDQNQDSESDPECCSPKRPVNSKESHKTKEPLEFEQRQQNRPYWSQTLRPVRCCIRTTLSACLGGCSCLQFANMATDPFRLRRLRRQKRQAGQPTFARPLRVA